MLLSDWLEKNNVTRTDFARRVGVTPQTITGWCKGSFWIERDRAKAVYRETNGEVTPTDFLNTDEVDQ